MAAAERPAPKTVLSEQMQVTWPIVVAIAAATWWLQGTLSDMRSQLTRVVEIVGSHENRLTKGEEWRAERGPRIDAIERTLLPR